MKCTVRQKELILLGEPLGTLEPDYTRRYHDILPSEGWLKGLTLQRVHEDVGVRGVTVRQPTFTAKCLSASILILQSMFSDGGVWPQLPSWLGIQLKILFVYIYVSLLLTVL